MNRAAAIGGGHHNDGSPERDTDVAVSNPAGARDVRPLSREVRA